MKQAKEEATSKRVAGTKADMEERASIIKKVNEELVLVVVINKSMVAETITKKANINHQTITIKKDKVKGTKTITTKTGAREAIEVAEEEEAAEAEVVATTGMTTTLTTNMIPLVKVSVLSNLSIS
jgi:hypothetical protein